MKSTSDKPKPLSDKAVAEIISELLSSQCKNRKHSMYILALTIVKTEKLAD